MCSPATQATRVSCCSDLTEIRRFYPGLPQFPLALRCPIAQKGYICGNDFGPLIHTLFSPRNPRCQTILYRCFTAFVLWPLIFSGMTWAPQSHGYFGRPFPHVLEVGRRGPSSLQNILVNELQKCHQKKNLNSDWSCQAEKWGSACDLMQPENKLLFPFCPLWCDLNLRR